MPQNKSLFSDTPLFFFLCLLLVWLPVPLGSMRPWAQGVMEVWLALLVLGWLVVFIGGRVVISPVLYQCRYIFILLFMWFAYLAAQLLLGSDVDDPTPGFFLLADPHITAQQFLLSIAYCLLFFLIIVLCNSRRRIKTVMVLLVFSGLFQALYGSLMTLSGLEYHFFMKKWSYLGVATGTFINRNHFAAYLVMCLATGIGLMISQLSSSDAINLKGKIRHMVKLLLSPKIRLRLYLVIMVIALVLTRSRMGNIAFFSSLTICGALALWQSRYAMRSMMIFLVSIIIVDIFIVGAWFGIDKVAQRLEETSVVTEARTEVFEYAYLQWQDNFLTGSGLGSFPSTFPQYRQHDIYGLYYHTHSDYLQFAVEVGAVGLIILACIALSSLIVALMAQFRRRDSLMRGLSFAAMMGIIAMLIHATVEFNFQIPANAAMFMVLLAFAWISLFFKDDRNGVSRGRNKDNFDSHISG